MNVRAGRLGGAGAIVLGSLLAAAVVLAVAITTDEDILRNVALAVVVCGTVVFAPIYLLYGAWFDEFGDRRH